MKAPRGRVNGTRGKPTDKESTMNDGTDHPHDPWGELSFDPGAGESDTYECLMCGAER